MNAKVDNFLSYLGFFKCLIWLSAVILQKN